MAGALFAWSLARTSMGESTVDAPMPRKINTKNKLFATEIAPMPLVPSACPITTPSKKANKL